MGWCLLMIGANFVALSANYMHKDADLGVSFLEEVGKNCNS